MHLSVVKYLFVPIYLSTVYVTTKAQNVGYTINEDDRKVINKQVFTCNRKTLKWTAKEVETNTEETPQTAATTNYSFFPGYRGILEGYGFEYSLSRFDKFKVRPYICPKELAEHLKAEEGVKKEKVFANKPTIVGVIMKGGNSHNVVVALFFRWLKGEQVVFWRCRNAVTGEPGYSSKKKTNSDAVEKQIEDMLKLMQNHGVPVYNQLTDVQQIRPDVNVELIPFMMYTNIIGVINGMTGQGVEGTTIYPKALMGLELIRRLIELGAAQWEADVLTFYQSSLLGEKKGNMTDLDYQALCADKLRVLTNPEGTTPINAFMGHEPTVPGEYHLVVPAPVDQFLEKQSFKKAPTDFYYKKMVVNITEESAIDLLENKNLYTDLSILMKLSELLKVDETEYYKPSMWTNVQDRWSRFRNIFSKQINK